MTEENIACVRGEGWKARMETLRLRAMDEEERERWREGMGGGERLRKREVARKEAIWGEVDRARQWGEGERWSPAGLNKQRGSW